MENQNAATELTAEEAAYFESGGEQEIALPAAPEQGPTDGQGQEGLQAQTEEVTQERTRDDKGRFVPHQALHAEREEHKKTKSELEQIRQQQAVLNDLWNTLLQLRQGQDQQTKAQVPPDPETDIFAYAKWQGEQVRKLQEKLESTEKQTIEQRQIEEQERGIWSEWQSSAQSYASQAPDFGDALGWLSNLRTTQLKAMATIDERFASDAGINQQINAELRQIVIAAKQKGVNPAQVVHDMAKAYGYQAKQADPKGAPTLPDKLDAIAKAQEQAKTIGAASGRSGGDQLTPETIAAMSPKEFEAWAADPKNARLLDKMLGA